MRHRGETSCCYRAVISYFNTRHFLPIIKSTTVTVTLTMMILDFTFCIHAFRCARLAASLNSFPAMFKRSLASCRSSSLSPRSITFWTLSLITSVTSWICSLTLKKYTRLSTVYASTTIYQLLHLIKKKKYRRRN